MSCRDAGSGAVCPSAAKEFAEKVEFRCPAPKGASDFKRLAVSLKRYPDTKLSFSALCKAAMKIAMLIAAVNRCATQRQEQNRVLQLTARLKPCPFKAASNCTATETAACLVSWLRVRRCMLDGASPVSTGAILLHGKILGKLTVLKPCRNGCGGSLRVIRWKRPPGIGATLKTGCRSGSRFCLDDRGQLIGVVANAGCY